MIYTPRHYQQNSHDAAWHYLKNCDGNPLIVLPTGSGKSLVIAMLIQQAMEFDARVVLLQHRKELIRQNAEKIQALLPDADIGINSAGLNQRDVDHDIVCAGIQSVYNKAEKFGRRELVIIDEAHLINGSRDDSMYGTFLKDLTTINPKLRLVGLTATPFRTGEGVIYGDDGHMFSGVCFESKTGQLIEEGFLCEITNNPADATVDTSTARVHGGEFVAADTERIFNTDDNVTSAVTECVTRCEDRKSILVFSSGVAHAERIKYELQSIGERSVEVVTGTTPPLWRESYLSDFKTGELRWLVNCDVLTTGFDAPRIDAICVLRATMSPGLFAQICGRGLRQHPDKQNCLILDFGENLKRHGQLDSDDYGLHGGKVSGGSGDVARPADDEELDETLWKRCPACGIAVNVAATECSECGFMIPREMVARHGFDADLDSPVVGDPEPETYSVQRTGWCRWTKRNDPEALPTLRVDYVCKQPFGNIPETISEWVCFEHDGFARRKAVDWWVRRSLRPVPESIDEAIRELDRGVAMMPLEIEAKREGRFMKILSEDYGDQMKPDIRNLPEVTVPDYDDFFSSNEYHSEFDDDVPF